jgi:mannose-6-phosphate isomerase-like protein (cupin superfamily)
MYYVIGGKGQFTCAGETVNVETGRILFVEKGTEHRFHDITEDITLLVVFAPAEGSKK